MALRFGSQSLASGLLFAAQTAFIGTLVTGTGNFSVALEVSQTGQGELPEIQVVTGTGSHGIQIQASQEGSGRLPQIVTNFPSPIQWSGGAIAASQEGEGESGVAPPQTVAGTGDFAVALDLGQSGAGEVAVPPQHATGTGEHGITLAISQAGEGESVVPTQVVQGSGTFTISLAVSQSGEGHSEVEDDTTPDQFSFPPQIGVGLEETIVSDPAIITGINAPSPISVSGGEYSINGSAYTDQPGTVKGGDSIRARHDSAGTYLTSVTTTVTVGGVSAQLTSITRTQPAAGGTGGQGRVRLGGMMVFG